MPASRYFGAFILIVASLYALVFFAGDIRTPQLGLDLRGGTTVTLTARTPNGQAPAPEDLELARQIIEQRVNGLGVAEAEVVTEGDSNIVISVPGDDGQQARELGATAQLRFRPVIQAPEPAGPAPTDSEATPTDGAAPTDSAAPTDAATSGESAPATTEATPSDGAVSDPSLPDPDAPPVTLEEATAQYATLTC
jgi:preprotein translocase subunit SecD